MDLKIEVEELQFVEQDGYRVIVRANRYRNVPRSEKLGTETFTYSEQEKLETQAQFTVRVSRIAHRARKRARPIEDIEEDARSAVFQLCREIVKLLEAKPK